MMRFFANLFVALCLMSPVAVAGDTAGNKTPAGTASDLSVPQAWARATPGGSTIGAAYLTIKNAAITDDKLISITTGVAGRAELHTHIMSKGVMRMRRKKYIAIPAGKTIVLKPGGDHVMLFDLKSPLASGEKFNLILRFEKTGQITVSTDVLRIGSPGPDKMKPAGIEGQKSKTQTLNEVLERHRGSHSHN